MSDRDDHHDLNFRLLRAKRDWLPEWAWRALGQLPVRSAVVQLLTTRDARSADEALKWWDTP